MNTSNNISTKVNVTYRNLLLLALALGGVIFFAQQILSDLNINIAFFHFKIAGFNVSRVFGFIISLYGTWGAFKATKKAESKEHETSQIKFLETQYQIVMREIDENKKQVEKVEDNLTSQAEKRGERIGESEQKLYALSLQMDNYQEIFKGYILLEDRVIKTEAKLELRFFST